MLHRKISIAFIRYHGNLFTLHRSDHKFLYLLKFGVRYNHLYGVPLIVNQIISLAPADVLVDILVFYEEIFAMLWMSKKRSMNHLPLDHEPLEVGFIIMWYWKIFMDFFYWERHFGRKTFQFFICLSSFWTFGCPIFEKT